MGIKKGSIMSTKLKILDQSDWLQVNVPKLNRPYREPPKEEAVYDSLVFTLLELENEMCY